MYLTHSTPIKTKIYTPHIDTAFERAGVTTTREALLHIRTNANIPPPPIRVLANEEKDIYLSPINPPLLQFLNMVYKIIYGTGVKIYAVPKSSARLNRFDLFSTAKAFFKVRIFLSLLNSLADCSFLSCMQRIPYCIPNGYW